MIRFALTVLFLTGLAIGLTKDCIGQTGSPKAPPQAFPTYGVPQIMYGSTVEGMKVYVRNSPVPSGTSDFAFVSLLNDPAIRREVALTSEQEQILREFYSGLQPRLDARFGTFSRTDLTAEMREEIQTIFDEITNDLGKQIEDVLLPHQHARLKQMHLRKGNGRARFIDQLRSPPVAETIELSEAQDEQLAKHHDRLSKELEAKIEQLRLEYRNDLIEVLKTGQQAKVKELFGDDFFENKKDD